MRPLPLSLAHKPWPRFKREAKKKMHSTSTLTVSRGLMCRNPTSLLQLNKVPLPTIRKKIYVKCIQQHEAEDKRMDALEAVSSSFIQSKVDTTSRAVAEVLIDARNNMKQYKQDRRSAVEGKSSSSTKRTKLDLKKICQDLHDTIRSIALASNQQTDLVSETQRVIQERKQQALLPYSLLNPNSDTMLIQGSVTESKTMDSVQLVDQMDRPTFKLAKKAIALLEHGDYDGMTFDTILHQILNPQEQMSPSQVQDVINHIQAESTIHMKEIGDRGMLSGQFELIRKQRSQKSDDLHKRYPFLKSSFQLSK